MTSFVIKQGIYLCVARHAIRSLIRSDKIYSFIINPSVDHLISGWQSCFQTELSAAARYWCVHIATTLRDDRSLCCCFCCFQTLLEKVGWLEGMRSVPMRSVPVRSVPVRSVPSRRTRLCRPKAGQSLVIEKVHNYNNY